MKTLHLSADLVLPLDALHSMGAADYPDRGAVRASPVLFLEGA